MYIRNYVYMHIYTDIHMYIRPYKLLATYRDLIFCSSSGTYMIKLKMTLMIRY